MTPLRAASRELLRLCRVVYEQAKSRVLDAEQARRTSERAYISSHRTTASMDFVRRTADAWTLLEQAAALYEQAKAVRKATRVLQAFSGDCRKCGVPHSACAWCLSPWAPPKAQHELSCPLVKLLGDVR